MDVPAAFPHRRTFTRVRLPITALVSIDGTTRSVAVRDVCLNGIGFHADTPMDVGAPCTVELRLDGSSSESSILAIGNVARVAADAAGIQFLELVGIDSLNRLRTLLVYHAENPDELLAEFDAHWGLLPR